MIAAIDINRRHGYAADEALCLGNRLIPDDPPRDPHRAAIRQR
jgi:hypothetical protein